MKEFAAQMADEHMKISRQLEELASKKGVTLPPGLNQEHKRRVDELSQLSGHVFDRTYLSYIMRTMLKSSGGMHRRCKIWMSGNGLPQSCPWYRPIEKRRTQLSIRCRRIP